MASGLYQRLLANLMNKEIDLEADTIKVALMDVSHAFNGSQNTFSQVSANEVTGAGYTAGGETLTGKSVTQGAITVWDANDVAWTDATLSAYHAVLYDDTLAGDDLIASIDFGGEQAIADGNISIVWDVLGIIKLTEV